MFARPENAFSIIFLVSSAYMTAWRTLTSFQGSLSRSNMMKRVPKPSTLSILQPSDLSWSMDSGGTDSEMRVEPSSCAVTRAVASTRESIWSFLSLAG